MPRPARLEDMRLLAARSRGLGRLSLAMSVADRTGSDTSGSRCGVGGMVIAEQGLADGRGRREPGGREGGMPWNMSGGAAAGKVIWLVLGNTTADWGKVARQWTEAMNPFAIPNVERFTQNACWIALHGGNGKAPPLPERGVVLGPVKLWVVAMLAPKHGLRVAPVPSLRGEFDRACAQLPKCPSGNKPSPLNRLADCP